MVRHDEDRATIDAGVNSSVSYGSDDFHVQTQCSMRDAPVIESLVYRGGQVLVRITASYGDVARRLGFTGDDGRHLLELQHADVVRKIRNGMLRDDEGPLPDRSDPAVESDVPSVHALLRDLDAAVERVAPSAAIRESGGERSPGPARSSPRPARRRWVIRLLLPF